MRLYDVHEVSVERVELVLVGEEVELRVVLLLRLHHDLHLGAVLADEHRRALNDRSSLRRRRLSRQRQPRKLAPHPLSKTHD